MRKVLISAHKGGFLYVVDRTNGRLIAANPYVRVNWATHIDMKTGRPVLTDLLDRAIKEIQRVYSQNFFPEMKVNWRTYPNDIGHSLYTGCFRCHDEKHKTSAGQTVRASDCKSCHTIIAQGKSEQLDTLSAKGLDFEHPGGELDPDLTCSDCHNGGIQGK